MQGLLRFLVRYQVTLIFLLLEVVSLMLVFQHNDYQRSAFLSSANVASGYLLERSDAVVDFIQLSRENRQLRQENAQLREQLEATRHRQQFVDSGAVIRLQATPEDTASLYELYPAKVINASHRRMDNYFTLNRGRKHGLRPGMGLVGPDGLIGIVKTCSDSYATAFMLLHSGMSVSARLKKNNQLCTVEWQTGDYQTANLRYISKTVPVAVGDTVVTSGVDAIYPPGTLIGTVSAVEAQVPSSYQDIRLRLSVDFSQVDYVYAVNVRFRTEKDSLENVSVPTR